MKYIRTKDELGIEREDGTCCFRTWAANPNSPLKEDWLYADTIEELCDEFVVIHKELNGNHTIHKYNWIGKSEHEAGNKVFGAIWTDKGLIFVARMNNEGVLELL